MAANLPAILHALSSTEVSSRMKKSLSGLALMVLAALLAACSAAPLPQTAHAPAADITLTDRGCTSTQFVLPATREPHITVANQAAETMVFSIPEMNRWVAVPGGQQADFELPRYIMGDFDFFCLTEAAHIALGGGNPLVCAFEPGELAPVARSRGLFEIQQHNRINEVISNQPAPPSP